MNNVSVADQAALPPLSLLLLRLTVDIDKFLNGSFRCILTSVDSDEPVQPPSKLRNSK